jgi:hexokinase
MKHVFQEEMALGFAKHPSRAGSLLMMNTYITRDFENHQNGSYLSLDLGSTNFRVCHLQFVEGERNDRFHVKYYDIPPTYRVGPAAPVSVPITKRLDSRPSFNSL